ncbi:MAG: CARDB domain-containing protein [Candidatus Hatepunaea meridiana]|nr:CARDB domain-containing protein [Candidatus Hatepunaea meridiana]
MPLSTDEFLEDGSVTVRFEAVEKYGRDARPLEMTVETRALVPPELTVSDMGIDDDDQDNSFGNSNGKIEKGETIEVRAIVQNKGQGDAEAVTVELTPAQGVFFVGKQTFNLGDLSPGTWREINFAFTVPPTYSGSNDLPFKLKIGEARKRYGAEETLSLALNR